MAGKKKESNPIKSLAELRSLTTEKMGVDAYRDPSIKRDIISTGFHTLDNMLNGGVRCGTYIELYGEQGTGKTYLALNIMREAQEKFDKPVCYMDFEKAWDVERSEQIGLNLDPEMIDVVSPPNMEQGWDYLAAAVSNDIFSVIVVDSVASMVPKIEIEEDMEKEQVAKAARVMSKGFRVLTAGLKDTVVIFINQQREAIGVLFGDPKTTPGGKAKNFYAHMRLECVKLKRDPEEREVYSAKLGRYENVNVSPGHYIKVKFIKSRMGNETKSCQLVYDYDLGGVDRTEDYKSFLFENRFIEKEGNFYTIRGLDSRINGKKQLYEFIRDNFELMEKLASEAKANDSNNDTSVVQGDIPSG